MANITNYTPNPNFLGVNGYGVTFCNKVYTVRLAATTDTTLTVPDGIGMGRAANTRPKLLAKISYAQVTNRGDVWVAVGTSAVPNTTGLFVESAGALNPDCRQVNAGDVLHFYATAATDVSVEFYAVQN